MELLIDRSFEPGSLLCEEESLHCVKVMRHRVGDEVFVGDGNGRRYRCKIADAYVRGCSLDVVEVEEFPVPSHYLRVAVALTKNIDRFEWFVEKAVEMGISRITPIVCEHSERARVRLDRVERIIVAACKQSLKYYIPEIDELTEVSELINTSVEEQRYILHCQEGEKRHLFNDCAPGQSSLVMIGPEGDFSQREICLALSKGFRQCTLGEERLRTETAAMVATHIIDLRNQI